MRRLVVLFLVALAGASVFGLSGRSSGITVSGASVSTAAMNRELDAIRSSQVLQCYLSVSYRADIQAGAGVTLKAAGAAAWSNIRVEGLAIEQYVRQHFGFTPTAASRAQALSTLEGEFTQAAAVAQVTCPGTSAQAVAAMTDEMRNAQLDAQSASLVLLNRLNSTIPLTTSSIEQYYSAHKSSYDLLCISIALVKPSMVSAFSSAAASGMSVANLAKKFSVDTQSAAKGGVYGCYGPTSPSYTSVRADIVGTPLGRYTTQPRSVSLSGVTYGLFIAPTKRTTSPLADATPLVLNDLKTLNASGADSVKQQILYRAAVALDPAFGRWGLASTGPQVFAAALPDASNVTSPSTLTTASSPTYK